MNIIYYLSQSINRHLVLDEGSRIGGGAHPSRCMMGSHLKRLATIWTTRRRTYAEQALHNLKMWFYKLDTIIAE